MKKCINCGQNIEDNDRYCPYCNTQQPVQQQYQNPYGGMNMRERPVSTGGWILRLLLMCIPIVNIVMLFIWGFDQSENETARNWARAQLIWMAIILGVTIFFVVLAAVTGGLLYSTYSTIR